MVKIKGAVHKNHIEYIGIKQDFETKSQYPVRSL